MADHATQAGGVDASVRLQHGVNCFSRTRTSKVRFADGQSEDGVLESN